MKTLKLRYGVTLKDGQVISVERLPILASSVPNSMHRVTTKRITLINKTMVQMNKRIFHICYGLDGIELRSSSLRYQLIS